MSLRRFAVCIVAMSCTACGLATPRASDHSDPGEIANEASSNIAPAELTRLQQSAQAGNLSATQQLVNHYVLTFGYEHRETIRWELHGARLGDCELWADLRFMEQHERTPVPNDLFQQRESLDTIGERTGCARVSPLRP